MADAGNPKFRLPKIQSATLRGFTLFSQIPLLQLSLRKRVFCLAGANGLGKSTFMAALNFGLTGRVPEPERAFRSVEEYFRHTEAYSGRFFEGRIGELDREEAEIELDFQVGSTRFTLTRGLFEPTELRRLSILDGDQLLEIDSSHSPAQLNNLYGQKIVDATKLHSFEQFVFLQLFLLTFDERRTLTFWEPLILEQLLQLAFGYDPGEAHQADSLRRRAERRDSNARNLNYQATETRKRLRDIDNFLSKQTPDLDDLVTRHQGLEEQRREMSQRFTDTEAIVKDSRLRLATLSARASGIRHQFDEAFALRASSQHRVDIHPLVIRSLSEHTCQLCGTATDDAVTVLQRRVAGPVCPLCGSQILPMEESEDVMAQLRRLDDTLSQVNKEIESEQARAIRLEQERDELRRSVGQLEQEIEGLEKENEVLSVMTTGEEEKGLRQMADSYRLRIKELNEGKLQARRDRDEALSALKKIQDNIAGRYRVAEVEFLPSFKQLAFAFLGIDLNIRFESRSGQMRLVLEVEGQPRRQQHELSESQRFFLDIALRMAVANYITGGRRASTMFIDTPEGSLDAAYESRAGEMFAQFVDRGNSIVMTANINTSQLLRRLASRCQSNLMHLERMTEWAQLSEVQLAEENLFDEAFGMIEQALTSGRS